MKPKYKFIKQPPKGELGQWVTADGFICYTNRRDRAVAWYKKHLKKQTS